MLAEYHGAIWRAIPGFGYPQGVHGRIGHTAKWIILHGTASGDGTAEQQVAFFQHTTAHGVHFVIGKDGAVYQMVALADAAYGNGIIQAPHDPWWVGNPNLDTVSIEHCKTASDNSDILTPEQQQASFELIAWLCQSLNIPARPADASGGITGHYSIEGIDRKNCPGAYPWAELWQFLGASMIPIGPFVTLTFGHEIPSTVGWKSLANQFGLSQADFLAIPGNSYLSVYDGNSASVQGMPVQVPGYRPAAQVVPPTPGPDPVAEQVREALKRWLA